MKKYKSSTGTESTCSSMILVIINNKTVDRLLHIHMAQILTFIKMKELRLGYLINWNVKLIKDGIQRLVNNL